MLFNFRSIPNTVSIKFRNCPIKFLEHVQIKVDLNFSRRGDLSLQLKAPSSTISPMTRRRVFDNLARIKNLTDWVMTTLFNWGESPEGEWQLIIADLDTRYPSKGNSFLGLFFFIVVKAIKHHTAFCVHSFLPLKAKRDSSQVKFSVYQIDHACPKL